MRQIMIAGVLLMSWTAQAGAGPLITGAFQAQRVVMLIPETGPTTAAFEFSYPGHTTSQPGEYARWPLPATSPGRDAVLSFHWSDTFVANVPGYHVLQVLVGERVVWEGDVSGGDLQPHRVEVPLAGRDLPAAGQPLPLSIQLIEKKQVTNFVVRVQVGAPALTAGGQATALLDSPALARAEPWPPEPPLPALPAVGRWTWQANIVQPWGTTQTVAVKQAAEWAPRFAREHGLNALIMLPPPAHNAITGAHGLPEAPNHITDEEFRRAVALYRAEGMRLILYTSIMHMGHDPSWQMGGLAQTHPEWAMRDPAGNTVNMYGNPWLCPSTGALQATLQYTIDLVRKYDADAVMLDNNEFMATTEGRWTCTCAGCQAKFRQYLVSRFGQRTIPGTQIEPASAAIPEQDTEPLWGVWLNFRNRTWAEACETFRRELRRVKPDLVVLANTQYLYRSGLLAVDGQYPHLDAVLSESRGHTGVQMVAKMLVGRALAQGRPLWNYIGTFDEEDFKRLRPAAEVAGLCAASAAVGANPWIVFYGFVGEENQPALAMLRQYNDFWHDHAALLGEATVRGEVGLLLSTESRDLLQKPLAPPALEGLLRAGLTVQPLRDAAGLTADNLKSVRVLLATGSPCLREDTARALANWVRRGGHLVITPEAGWRDEVGRWRAQSALSQALKVRVTTPGTHRCGPGTVTCVAGEGEVLPLVERLIHSPVQAEGPVAVVAQQARDGRRVLSLVGLEGPIGAVTVTLPSGARRAQLLMPGHEPRPLTATSSRLKLTIPERLGLIVY